MGESVKTKRKKDLCYQCGSTLHRAKDCPESVCKFCGESGHTPGSCPHKEELVDLGSFGASRGKVRYIELFAGIGGFRLALGTVLKMLPRLSSFCDHTLRPVPTDGN